MELLDEFVSWLVQVIFYVMLFYAARMVVTALIQKFTEPKMSMDLEQAMKHLETNQLIPMLIEVEGNIYYCYNSTTKDFICQGQNIQEILSKFKQRYPGKYCALYQGSPEVLTKLKQQLKELNENSDSIGSPS